MNMKCGSSARLLGWGDIGKVAFHLFMLVNIITYIFSHPMVFGKTSLHTCRLFPCAH